MPDFAVDPDRLTVFRVGEEYVFSRYFEREALFADLQEYYDDGGYRFEVPTGEFEAVEERLSAAHYDPVVVEDPEPYCVVTGKYEEHADVLRDAVVHWERRDHHFFLLPDQHAVEKALRGGAERVGETEFALGI